jgi:cation diffusion facilitator family transporter
MEALSTQKAQREITRVTILGAVINILLAGGKIIVGTLSGSPALVADGIHSVSDLISDLAVLLGSFLSNLPPDKTLPYGYGKFETFATLFIALALLGTGGGIAFSSGISLYHHEIFNPGMPVLVTALISILAKETIYQLTKTVATRTRSPSVLANAWHHRSDALSSVAVLIGAAAGMLGWSHGDQVAGVLVGLMVSVSGFKIGFNAIMDLAEASVDKISLGHIIECLNQEADVLGWHELRTRTVGREVFIDVHVLLEPNLTVNQGHIIVDRVQDEIEAKLTTPTNFTIHMEPFCEAQLMKESPYRGLHEKKLPS